MKGRKRKGETILDTSPLKPGWNRVTGVRVKCDKCKEVSSFNDVMHWTFKGKEKTYILCASDAAGTVEDKTED